MVRSQPHHAKTVLQMFFVFIPKEGLVCFGQAKGTTINDLGGGPEEIERKKFRRPFSRKKLQKGLPQGKKNWSGYREENINSFSNFPPPPQIINGRPLNTSVCCTSLWEELVLQMYNPAHLC